MKAKKIEIFQTGVPHKTEANPKVGWPLELWEGFRKKIIFAPHGLFQGRPNTFLLLLPSLVGLSGALFLILSKST